MRVAGLRVGVVVDLVADAALARVVGAEVLTLASQTQFLPWAAASSSTGGVEIASALVLLGVDQLEWYREQGVRLAALGVAELDGLAVEPGGAIVRAAVGLTPAWLG